VGKDVGISAAASYKSANELGLRDLTAEAGTATKALRSAAEELQNAAAEINALSSARRRVEELTETNSGLEGQISTLRRSLEDQVRAKKQSKEEGDKAVWPAAGSVDTHLR
jgi:chromosome segregation ATPase